jgi:hypothetical protein
MKTSHPGMSIEVAWAFKLSQVSQELQNKNLPEYFMRDVIDFKDKSRPAELNYQDGGDQVKSPQAPAKTGGLDFRALPIAIQPAIVPAALLKNLENAPMVSAEEMDKRWAAIQTTMARGQIPYAELKKFVTACYSQKIDSRYRKAATKCVLNLLKLEEERAVSTPDELKQIVVLL